MSGPKIESLRPYDEYDEHIQIFSCLKPGDHVFRHLKTQDFLHETNDEVPAHGDTWTLVVMPKVHPNISSGTGMGTAPVLCLAVGEYPGLGLAYWLPVKGKHRPSGICASLWSDGMIRKKRGADFYIDRQQSQHRILWEAMKDALGWPVVPSPYHTKRSSGTMTAAGTLPPGEEDSTLPPGEEDSTLPQGEYMEGETDEKHWESVADMALGEEGVRDLLIKQSASQSGRRLS